MPVLSRSLFTPLFIIPLLTGTLMTGCGSSDGSDSDASTNTGFLQFYNASANSASAELTLASTALSAIGYGDSSASYLLDSSTDVSIQGLDNSENVVTLFEQTLDSNTDTRHVLIMAGDYAAPEFIDFIYQDDELEDGQMAVYAAHLGYYSQTHDIYLGLASGTFESAQMLGNFNYKDISDVQLFDIGSYVLYLTEPGQNTPVFTSTDINLSSEIHYILAIKDTFGPGQTKLAVDLIDHSTTVYQHNNQTANAEFRVFNALPDNQLIDVTTTSTVVEVINNDIQPHQATAFYQVGFDDYGFTVNTDDGQTLLNNMLVSLTQDDSRTVLIYQDEAGDVKGLSYQEEHRPRAFSSQIVLSNLSFKYDAVDVYFIRQGETIETADYKIEHLTFEEIDSLELPLDDYEVVVVHQENNGTSTLIHQSSVMSINNNTGYSMVLSADSNEVLGHQMTVLE